MKITIKKISIVLFVLSIFSSDLFAWEGYDSLNNTIVEIDKGNLVRKGETIEILDYSTGQYHSADVESVRQSGGTTEVEVFDYNTGDFRILDMGY
jgi:hypothetical protein